MPEPVYRYPTPDEWLEHTLRGFDRRIKAAEHKLSQIGATIVSVQDQVDAAAAALADLNAKVTSEDSALKAAVVAIQEWIAAQPPAVDVTGLEAAVSTLTAANDELAADVTAAAALVPAAPPVA
jgi:septal ring factor EnvC (AmiA/AmiB activator)